MISPLSIPASQFGYGMASFQGARKSPIFGVVVHTTGSGLPKKARSLTAADTLAEGVRYYATNGGPVYVVGWDGRIVAVADEATRTWHCGVDDATARTLYRSGSAWMSKATPAAAARWRSRWPAYQSPFDIIPGGEDCNSAYIGIEMIPVTDGSSVWTTPMRPGLRFTRAQHEAVRKLVDDIGRRHGFPAGWKSSRRLIGHFDVNPLERQDSGGGWDPGYQRANPYIDWAYIRGGLDGTVVLKLALTGFVAWGAYQLLK